MNKNQVVHTALDRLKNQTGIEALWNICADEVDGAIKFLINEREFRMFVEVKSELRYHHLPQLFDLAGKYKPLMVVAEKIFPTIKETLRNKKIAYLDTAGNIYIHTDKNFIWIDGNKTNVEKRTVTNRAFTKTGLKIVFYLLINKDAVNIPYRKLAEATDVALGNIKNVIDGLKEAGFILRINDNKLKLQNKKALLERWLVGYRETLKPTLLLGKYKFWNKENLPNWQMLPIQIRESQWGGEPAGEFLTNYLVPINLALYTNQKTALVTKWILLPDENGNVALYKKFWKDETLDNEKFAPPLLVYADLMLTDDPRCQETAQMIYDKYLHDEFE